MCFIDNNKILMFGGADIECIRIGEPGVTQSNIIQNQINQGANVHIASVEILFKSGNKLNGNVLADEVGIFKQLKASIINQKDESKN